MEGDGRKEGERCVREGRGGAERDEAGEGDIAICAGRKWVSMRFDGLVESGELAEYETKTRRNHTLASRSRRWRAWLAKHSRSGRN